MKHMCIQYVYSSYVNHYTFANTANLSSEAYLLIHNYHLCIDEELQSNTEIIFFLLFR